MTNVHTGELVNFSGAQLAGQEAIPQAFAGARRGEIQCAGSYRHDRWELHLRRQLRSIEDGDRFN